MKTFIPLTVAFTKDQTRTELINMAQVVRIIQGNAGTMVCFNSSGTDHIMVKESRHEIEKLVNG